MKILKIMFENTNIFNPERVMKTKASGDYLLPERVYFHSCHGFSAEQTSLTPTELREEEYIF